MRAYLIEEQSRINELATQVDDDEDFDELAQEGEFGQDPADILAHREEMSGVNIRGVNIRGLIAVIDH